MVTIIVSYGAATPQLLTFRAFLCRTIHLCRTLGERKVEKKAKKKAKKGKNKNKAQQANDASMGI